MSETASDEERELKVKLMKADIGNKQADIDYKARLTWWETPKALAIVIGATAAVFTAIAGYAGFKLGSQPPAQPPQIIFQPPSPPQIIFQPGSIQVLPAAPAPAVGPMPAPAPATGGK